MRSLTILFTLLVSTNAATIYGTWFDIGSLHKTYFVGPEEITWQNALVKCLVKGPSVRLATIDTEEEMKLLNSFFTGSGYRLWIGLHRNPSGNFTRIFSTQSDYYNWAVGEPNNEGNEECAELRTVYGVWNDVSCGIKLNYLCEADKAPEVRRVCGGEYEGWKYFRNHCYFAGADHELAQSWESAESYCEERNSNLVSIHDVTEQTFLFSKMLQKKDSLHNLWSGLKYNNKKMFSTWIDGTPANFSNLVTEKDDANGCVSLNFLYKHWSVSDCSSKLGFVCKMPYEHTIKNSTKKEAVISQITNITEYVGGGGLKAGIIINIILTMVILIVLILLIRRWPSNSSFCLWLKSATQPKWTTLKEDEDVKEEEAAVKEEP